MTDGSDAIADWPILNALTSTRVRRDLGVVPPRGRRRYRPFAARWQVCVADGTALAGQKIARVLSNDPGLGVLRHIDSGDVPTGPDTLAAHPAGGVRLPS